MIKVMIVEDNAIVRNAIKSQLAEIDGVVVVSEAEDSKKAVEQQQEHEPDIIFLDYQLGLHSLTGISLIKRFLTFSPKVKIIMLTSLNSFYVASRAIAAGARGFLIKGAKIDKLEAAIQAVWNNEIHIDNAILEMFLNEPKRSPLYKEKILSLSPSEFEVMILISYGLELNDISQLLNLAKRTLYNSRSRILKTMKVQNDVQLTHLVIALDLIKIEDIKRHLLLNE